MFVSDNASNNDTLATSLEQRLKGAGLFKGRRHRVRCFAHILNLVMQVSTVTLYFALPPFSTHPKAFLRVFLRKKKGANSTGGDSEWEALADDINNYTSMASDDRDSDPGDSESLSAEDADNNELEGREDNEPIDTDIDREREEADDFLVDECENFVEQELSENDLVLEPITVAQRREACVLLSKVCNTILLQGPH
jgi:hypothetical protein